MIVSIAVAKDFSRHMSEKITNNMVWVGADKWKIRSHKIEKSFWLDRFELTQKEHFAVMVNNFFLRGGVSSRKNDMIGCENIL
jgi:hypothetical protein